MNPIILESSDEVQYEIAVPSALLSGTIRNVIDDLGGETDVVLPLPEINSQNLADVITYLNYHVNDPPAQPDQPVDFISDWDRQFLGIRADNTVQNMARIYELIAAANYLDIKPLLDVTTKAVANALRGKSVEEMRAILGIQA